MAAFVCGLKPRADLRLIFGKINEWEEGVKTVIVEVAMNWDKYKHSVKAVFK